MCNLIGRLKKELIIRRILKKYRNSLPVDFSGENPKLEYHSLADAVFWSDEGLTNFEFELENVFRYVIHYRTNMISEEESKLRKKLNSLDKKTYKLAKKYFPNWIGFTESRCTYNSDLSKKIERLRKVSDWKLQKLIDETM